MDERERVMNPLDGMDEAETGSVEAEAVVEAESPEDTSAGETGGTAGEPGDADSAGRQIVEPAHRATLLGSWVLSLLKLRVGDALIARDMQAAQIVLDILCLAALSLQLDPIATSPNPDERPPA